MSLLRASIRVWFTVPLRQRYLKVLDFLHLIEFLTGGCQQQFLVSRLRGALIVLPHISALVYLFREGAVAPGDIEEHGRGVPLVHVQWRLLPLPLAVLFWGPQLEQAFSNLRIVGVQVGCRDELLGFESRLDLLESQPEMSPLLRLSTSGVASWNNRSSALGPFLVPDELPKTMLIEGTLSRFIDDVDYLEYDAVDTAFRKCSTS